VSSLDGSDNLLILKAELVANNLELTFGQGDVNILGEKLHHFGHQVFKVVEPMEGESHNLQKPMLMSSHCLNLHMKVVQLPLIVEAHQGSKMPRRRNAPMPILILKLLWFLIARAEPRLLWAGNLGGLSVGLAARQPLLLRSITSPLSCGVDIGGCQERFFFSQSQV